MDFDILFFPLFSVLSIVFLIITLIMIIIYALLDIHNKINKKMKFIMFIIILLFGALGIVFQTQIKYQIRDYIENENATLVICKPDGLFDVQYIEVNYRDYWNHMNWYTYKYNSKENIIYMKRNKYY